MLLAALALTVTAAIVVGVALRLQAVARNEVVDVLDPTSLGIEQLRGAAVDQETGVRGYALEDNLALLEPYVLGQERQTEILDQIRTQLVAIDDPTIDRGVDRVEDAVERWRGEVAEPLIIRRDDATVAAVIERSRPLFDEVRAALDDADRTIEVRRAEARSDLLVATRLLFASLAAALLVAAVAIGSAAWVLRRRVVDPVVELNRRTTAVAEGEFGTDLDVRGVAEVEELAASVASMRHRISADLQRSEEARRLLDEQADELERSNRDLEQFAYVASHDLQEPLRKVASFCQLLDERYGQELDERGRTYVAFAADGARRMQSLISDLLQFSRVGRTTESFEPVELSEVMSDVLDQHAANIAASQAEIDVGELPTILGDRSLLTALFANLIGNAIKYRSEDAPRVTVATERNDDGWEVRITDNGIGIPPEYADKVFVIFQRLHGREEYDGTGIGLSLCKKIVEFHRGSIRIVDRDGAPGTQVLVTFPDPQTAGTLPAGHATLEST